VPYAGGVGEEEAAVRCGIGEVGEKEDLIESWDLVLDASKGGLRCLA
jgi:hypothetical protein